MKGKKGVPCLNPNPFKCYIGPQNLGEVVINGETATCLLDNGAQLNFVTPAYALKQGFNIMSLDWLAKEAGGQKLPPINGLGGLFVKPIGFILVNVPTTVVSFFQCQPSWTHLQCVVSKGEDPLPAEVRIKCCKENPDNFFYIVLKDWCYNQLPQKVYADPVQEGLRRVNKRQMKLLGARII